MAKKTSLRDFQAYLAERILGAAQGRGASSWLGVQAGDDNWLIDLSDIVATLDAFSGAGYPDPDPCSGR